MILAKIAGPIEAELRYWSATHYLLIVRGARPQVQLVPKVLRSGASGLDVMFELIGKE